MKKGRLHVDRPATRRSAQRPDSGAKRWSGGQQGAAWQRSLAGGGQPDVVGAEQFRESRR
jgi:hypothetical protein